jgi:hypothetical protein
MPKWTLAADGRCQEGPVPNCFRGKLHYQRDPRNAAPTEEELEAATARINEILENLTPPPEDPERNTRVLVADDEGRVRLAWVSLEPDEQDGTERKQS